MRTLKKELQRNEVCTLLYQEEQDALILQTYPDGSTGGGSSSVKIYRDDLVAVIKTLQKIHNNAKK